MKPSSKPAHLRQTVVRAPSRKQALLAGARALKKLRRQYAPEALMFKHYAIDTLIHRRAYLAYERLGRQIELLEQLAAHPAPEASGRGEPH